MLMTERGTSVAKAASDDKGAGGSSGEWGVVMSTDGVPGPVSDVLGQDSQRKLLL